MSKAPVSRPQRKLIAIFAPTQEAAADTAARLKVSPLYETLPADIDSFLAGPPKGAPPDIVILDVGQGDVLDNARLLVAREKWSQTPIIAVCDSLPQARMRQLVKLQVVDCLQNPVADEDLTSALAQVEGARRATDARVSTFISASGGSGATTMALMAASYLAEGSSGAGQTGLVDLDFQAANCGAYLNLVNEFNLDAIVGQPDRLDAELLEAIKLDRAPGITLYSFEQPKMLFSPSGRSFVLRLLDLAALSHQNIVIDLPNLATPWFDDVVGNSDTIFIIFEINVPSLRQARRLLARVREVRGNVDDVVPVANKSAFKLIGNSISRKDVEKIFAGRRLQAVARDATLLEEALNRGMFPTQVSGRSRMVKEANRVFQEVYGKSRKR